MPQTYYYEWVLKVVYVKLNSLGIVQPLSCVWFFAIPWIAAGQAPLSTIFLELLKFMSIESVMVSIHLIFCLPLLLPPSIFPGIRSFPMSRFIALGGQSIGASASVLSVNIQAWFPLGLTGLISLQSGGLTRVFSSTTVRKHRFFSAQSLWYNSHIHTWLLEKPQLWLYGPLSAKWCLCL